MNIVIIGATGGTGLSFLEQATRAGHRVVALARTPSKLEAWKDKIEIRQADARDKESLVQGLRGDIDAVVSIVGASGLLEARKVRDVYSVSTSNLLAAMRERGLDRFLAVSSSGLEPRESDNWFYVHILKRFFLGAMYEDMRRMEKIIEQSAARYTIVRPPYLTGGEVTGRYRILKGQVMQDDSSLRRADLAHFLLKAVENPEEYSRTAVAVSE